MCEFTLRTCVSAGRAHCRGRALALSCVSLLAASGALLRAEDESAPAGRKTPAVKTAFQARDRETLPGNPFPNRVKVSDLDGGTGWLNTAGEITLRDLRHKVVLLDFWTFCCINCMHILPDLKHLEQKYDKQLVVIGVHSAKFENEKDSENIRNAIMRYEIEHPVINDSNLTIWNKFGVNSWPTFVLIDPEGYFCSSVSGESHRETIELQIDRIIAYHRRLGTLDESRVRFDIERMKAPDLPLRYPGKVLADKTGGRLFISDSNHNRIVVASLDGRLLETIGSGAIGKANGAYDQASFDHPQGMALVGETLYVADTENHMLRAVDLATKQVRTVAGTGKQGTVRAGGAGIRTALNSPWDLVHVEGDLYVAMAGPHQVWSYDLRRHTIEPYAGSGREDVLNGTLRLAAMAQPSGITTDGKFLYVVDAEGSAVRKLPLTGRGLVTTVVGPSDLPGGRSLFEFGDRDGIGSIVRLQHPLGIAYHAGALFVADSYNHKIKQIDPAKGSATTFPTVGPPGSQVDPPRFSEPGGLSVAGNTLYVADTNNHLIRTVDLGTGVVSTLEISGLAPPPPAKPVDSEDPEAKKPSLVKVQRVAAGDALEFEVTLHLPEGYKLNKLAPITYRLKATATQTLVAEEQLQVRQEVEAPESGEVIRFDVPLASQAGKGELQLTLNYGYCREGTGGLCKLGTFGWIVPIEVAADGDAGPIRILAR